MLATTLQIDELHIPATIDAPDAADFIDMVAVRNAVETTAVGSDALACTAAELLPVYRRQEFDPKRIFVARVDGQIIGRAILSWSIADGTTSSWITAEVLAEFRGRGIGSAIYHTVEELALASGRPTLQVEAMHTATPGGPRIPSPTGFGDLPASDPGAQFLMHRGYRLEQTERLSFLDLPINRVTATTALRDARATAGEDYSLVRWSGHTPPAWVADIAVLHTRMSTDAPFAGLDMDTEPWDEARVANADESTAAGGVTALTVAALHQPTGRLVGFSQLEIPADRSRPTHQGDTLVLAEHRGRRLGMALKLANLLALQEVAPLPPMVCTFNAEENRHMLDVNEAIGFRAVGNAGCWRKHD